MSNSLVKLVDASLMPAAIMIVSKVLGLYLVVQWFDLSFQMHFLSNSWLNVYPVFPSSTLQSASSYSDFIMMVFMLTGLSIYVFRSIYLHNSHINPRIVAQLAKYNLLGLIKNAYRLYHEGSMWFLFSWIANVLVIINAVSGATYFWIPVIFLIANISLTTLFVRDIEAEIKRSEQNLQF